MFCSLGLAAQAVELGGGGVGGGETSCALGFGLALVTSADDGTRLQVMVPPTTILLYLHHPDIDLRLTRMTSRLRPPPILALPPLRSPLSVLLKGTRLDLTLPILYFQLQGLFLVHLRSCPPA